MDYFDDLYELNVIEEHITTPKNFGIVVQNM
jgi:hypothetical protein